MARKTSRDTAAAYPSAWTSILAPAPGDLRIVQALVNTMSPETGRDVWTDPAALSEWLGHGRLISRGTKLGPADLERAVAIRRGFRAMFLAHSGEPLDAAAVAELDRAVAPAFLRPRFVAGKAPFFEPAGSGFDETSARLFGIVAAAYAEGRWRRLKICANGGCDLAFYDSSNNLCGKWCTMRRCGNQVKARTFRRRHPDADDGFRPRRRRRAS